MRTSRGWWWLSGVVTGALGLTVSYLVAGILRVRESPVVAVAEGITALAPGSLAEWAIQTLGRWDKPILVVGIIVVLALVFGQLGRLARVRYWSAVLGYVVLAAVGLIAVLVKPATTLVDVLPVGVGLLAWLVALAVSAELLRRWELVESTDDAEDPTHSRRSVVVAIGAMAGVAAVSGLLGRVAISSRRRVEESRRLLRLDGVTAPKLPTGTRAGVDGVTPWVTPAEDFYLIDTAYIKPTIEPVDWSLRIHGMVERELLLSYNDLIAREITEDWITLNCVSNPVGGDLIGNAWWSGVRLAGVLAEAGPLEGADAVLQTSDDGWSCGTPLVALMDDRNAMLAVAMNGQPLPIEHGFPVRTIVPGLYGYVSACKWVVDMEVTRFADIEAYWTSKGWAEMGPVKMSSRIDVPGPGDDVSTGEVVCGGVAWSQHTGIAAVELSLDGGPWTPATLAKVPNVDTWVQWRVALAVEEGEHELRVRATDEEGLVQTGVERDVLPDGATGWHTITFSAA